MVKPGKIQYTHLLFKENFEIMKRTHLNRMVAGINNLGKVFILRVNSKS